MIQRASYILRRTIASHFGFLEAALAVIDVGSPIMHHWYIYIIYIYTCHLNTNDFWAMLWGSLERYLKLPNNHDMSVRSGLGSGKHPGLFNIRISTEFSERFSFHLLFLFPVFEGFILILLLLSLAYLFKPLFPLMFLSFSCCLLSCHVLLYLSWSITFLSIRLPKYLSSCPVLSYLNVCYLSFLVCLVCLIMRMLSNYNLSCPCLA